MTNFMSSDEYAKMYRKIVVLTNDVLKILCSPPQKKNWRKTLFCSLDIA